MLDIGHISEYISQYFNHNHIPIFNHAAHCQPKHRGKVLKALKCWFELSSATACPVGDFILLQLGVSKRRPGKRTNQE